MEDKQYMITCELGGKKYTVDMITGRVLREIGPAADMYAKLVKMSNAADNGEEVDPDSISISDALDVMVKWFCILFGNQFTPDEFYDNYPADRVVNDLTLAILAVQNQATSVLSTFPTTPTATEKAAKTRKAAKKG